MRWLVDENLPRAIADWLSQSGDDVLDVAASSHRGAADRELWVLAGAERRIIITRDLGFLWPDLAPHPEGVVIVRVPQEWKATEITELVRSSFDVLGGASLQGYVTVIDPRRIRQRPLALLPRR